MDGITEAKLYEAFGLTPTEQGGQGQEIAEPAAEAETDVQTAQTDTAEPAQQEADTEDGADTEPEADSEDPDEEDQQSEEGTETEKAPLSTQQRRENAARRRAQEQKEATQKAVDEAVQAEQLKSKQLLEEVLAQAGIKDTATGETITTFEQFQKWSKSVADARLQKDLKAGKLTKEVLDQMISAHPAVQQAQQIRQQAQEEQNRQRAEAERARIDDQMAKIAELNPAIKNLADILAMETAPAFRENVAKGMDFYDAYRLANMDAMAQEKARRAVQASQNNARGKEHLRATGNARGSGAASVPQDQLKLYRMMNPNMTDAQIQAHYNNYLKRGG